MKKLFYLLFISSFAFGSCTKQDPVEVICDCSGSNGNSSISSLVDDNLTGHWKLTNLTAYDIYFDMWTNSYDTTYFWNNGQIDLHFFADGTWDIDAIDGTGGYPHVAGSYNLHSDNCIKMGYQVFNYSINNGVLTFSSFPGQNDIRFAIDDDGNIRFVNPSQFDYTEVEINNLVKQ